MTYAAREASRSLGEPIALFLFRFGDGVNDYYGYTSGEESVSFNSRSYDPVPVANEAISQSGTLDKANIEVRLPGDLGIVDLFNDNPPSRPVMLVIYLGHVGETEFVANWSGRILSMRFDGDDQEEAIFTCEPVSSAFRRMGLRRTYGYGCPHVIYGSECGLSEVDFSVVGTVSIANSPHLTLTTGWSGAYLPTKFLRGRAKWYNAAGRLEIRDIVRIESADEIVLSGDLGDLHPGDAVTLSPGCDHVLDGDCVNLFNNALNFGGDPWIPLKNPLGSFNTFV